MSHRQCLDAYSIRYASTFDKKLFLTLVTRVFARRQFADIKNWRLLRVGWESSRQLNRMHRRMINGRRRVYQQKRQKGRHHK